MTVHHRQNDINITITGLSGSGKTTLLGEIMLHLRSLGLAVTAADDAGFDHPRGYPVTSPSPMGPTQTALMKEKRIHITAGEAPTK